MPTLTSTKTGGVISFGASDFLAGLSPKYQTGLSSAPGTISNQLMVGNAFHPYRNIGYASPGFLATDLTNASAVSGFLRNIAMASESGTEYGYAIADDNLLHRVDKTGPAITNAGSWPHTIVGAGAERGSDVSAYNLNVAGTRTKGILYSWNDSAGTWNVGLFNPSSGAFDDDFMSTVPATPLVPAGNNKPHPMIVGPDDLQYIADGNLLHDYDGAVGANGTFESTRLTLPAGYIITSFARLPDYLVLFAYYNPLGNQIDTTTTTSGEAIAVLWNYLDLDPTYIIPLTDNAVTAGFEYQGTVGCFTQGMAPMQDSENRFSSLQLWNGSSFETVAQFIGNPPIHGGVDIQDASIQWNSAGRIKSYGTPYQGLPVGLNDLGVASGAPAGTTSGLLRTIGGSSGIQLLSSGTTTNGGAQYMAPSTFGAATLMQTSAIAPYLPPGTIGKIKRIGMKFGKTSTATGRTLNAYLAKEGANVTTTQFISLLALVTAGTMTQFFDRNISDVYFGSFQELSLILQWESGIGGTSAPIVRGCDVEYEIENLVAN